MNACMLRNCSAIFGLQVIVVLFAAAGLKIGYWVARTQWHPAVWWVIVGASFGPGIGILIFPGGLGFWELSTWVLATIAAICFAAPGGFLFATLRSLEVWPRNPKPEHASTQASAEAG